MSLLSDIRVGITSIGSGIGQSVVDSCRLSSLPIKTFGYGMNPFAFGAYDCDEQRSLPSIYNGDYIEKLLDCCAKDNLDVLIPGHDNELLLFADNIQQFKKIGIDIPVSSRFVIELCRDKERMFRELSIIAPVFVKSYSRKNLMDAAERGEVSYPLIAKPISGFASKGLLVIKGIDDLASLTENHVIQELAAPCKGDKNHAFFMHALEKRQIAQVSELSLQVVLGKNGEELGRFASFNKLYNGVPIEIVPADVPEAWKAVDKFLPYLQAKGLRGPINIQGRMTDRGVRFFEMNARFTGITGLRALMGFNEVETIIADAANRLESGFKLTQPTRKIGIRQVRNRVVDVETNPVLASATESTGVYPWRKSARTILVTGANSFLGRAVLDALTVAQGVSRVIAVVRNPSRFDDTSEPFLPSGVECIDQRELLHGGFSIGCVDVICHLAFARPQHSTLDLADSLKYTHLLTAYAMNYQIPGFINASSQSVYGTKRPPIWTEETPPAPETPYATAKLSSELLAANISMSNSTSKVTSLRIARLIGPNPVLKTDDLLSKYLNRLMHNEYIEVFGGSQQLDLVDVRDVADLIVILATSPYDKWPDTMNVGGGHPITVASLAELVALMAERNGMHRPDIIVDPDHIAPSFGMSIKKGENIFGWHPERNLERTVQDMIDKLKSIKNPNSE
jgi:nucleoside-diphosphate-sugar epimerase/biotin carboxylase